MRITKYRTELDQNKHNILVKESAVNYEIDNLNNPQAIVEVLNNCFSLNRLAEEYMYIIALSTKNKPLGVFEVTHGTVNASFCTPREIFIRLLLAGASSFVLSHNHPSGDCTPSNEDIAATKRINESAKIIGITLLDHIIIADSTYNSFKKNGLL
jgi:DNA repair protein RadC